MKYAGLKTELEHYKAAPETPMYISEYRGDLLLITCELVMDENKLTNVYLKGSILEKKKSGRFEKKLLMHVQTQYKKDADSNSLFIGDIKVIDPKQRSKGYGSILMEQFLECAKMLEVSSITGSFSSTDATDDNRDRRRRVYEKYGFIVTDTKVYLDLKK